jgi:hypothetical protein
MPGSSTMRRMLVMTTFPIALATLTTTALLALGSPALASHGDDGGGGHDGRVVKTGTCSDGARWKLKVKTDDGRLEVEGEVDTNTSGQSWAWKVKDNGAVAVKGSATTSGASGSFSVERTITDQPGTDTIVFKASHSGEACSGAIAF